MMDPRLVELADGRHGDPFSLLGLHPEGDGWIVRTLVRGADAVGVRIRGQRSKPVPAELLHPMGLWQAHLPARQTRPPGYELVVARGAAEPAVEHDAFEFGTIIPDFDIDLLRAGQHRHLGHILGAHAVEVGGIPGVRFAVWAPNARRVSVVGDWNGFDGRYHPMRWRGSSGIWEIFIPGIGTGQRYKYEILAQDGALRVKADPVAWQAEVPPATASIVPAPSTHRWTDQDWLDTRAVGDPLARPLAVYEVHVGSWWRDRDQGGWPGWRWLADHVGAHAKALGFTHIELLPPAQHPFEGSWGYQVTGQYAPNSRHGTPDDFRAFVDRLHGLGLGVIVDFVPGHFPKDDFSLARFDGTPCYEYADPREGEHKGWGTCVFNFRRPEVRNFLIAAALHWIREFHIDGLRVDAVSSMLYRDYDRKDGEWVANEDGGNANHEAASLLRELNGIVRAEHPGVLCIAEESTAWQGVTAPPEIGGLGFHLKWNMGWMHDTLSFMALDPVLRSGSHDRITFHQWYAYDDKWVLPLSHDEVVHGKRSLIDKMPGDWWCKRAQLRLLYAWQAAVPGRPLLFQGAEFGMGREFDWTRSPDWAEAAEPDRRGLTACLAEALALYRGEPALHRRDDHRDGFRWVDCENRAESIVAFLRLAPGVRPVLAAFNFTPVPRPDYPLVVDGEGSWRILLDTDAARFGGAGAGSTGPLSARREGDRWVLRLHLPALAAVLLAPA